ncbi:MAG: hypothetical protein K0Q55_47 [Verrucomicrobia bacterium]|jgi:hypothetical protein|nr:hypothetical protein [Verrucomicrobiota bacterium]
MPKPKIIPMRLDPVAANVASISTLLTCSLLSWQLACRLPDYAPFRAIDILLFFIGLPLLIAFHEAVHALAWMLYGKLPMKAFEFGIIWRGFMPYCHCKEPMTVRVYRFGALMPLLVTVPVFIGSLFFHPAGWTALLTAFSLSGCLGDVWLFQKLNPIKRDDLVLDCPDEAGCDVIVKEEARSA